MDKLTIPSPSNDVPFNWDDLDFFLGQAAYSKGIYQALNTILVSLRGNNFIVQGCNDGGSSIVTAGWVVLDGELLYVDEHTSTDDYFEKVVTNNADGNKQTRLGGTVDIYKQNRATATASSGALENPITGSPLIGFDATSTNKGIVEKATTAERDAGTADKYIDAELLEGAIGQALKRKVINIGDWNMESASTASIAHGLDLANIRCVKATIRRDADDIYYDIGYTSTVGGSSSGGVLMNASTVVLTRTGGSVFDDPNFSNTSFNRGWIIIEYV